ncbi:hypothetical protein [Aequorivita sp. KMM 9714]|uniref:hypothetical protein n=1 Tax=Aequorivita sp. KMM 9714 TaxID=2707173 RepID=UPI0013E9CBF0|nr:hypothetical protein [Aequorivita sp. KMM 9714]NGX84800.1 hypothetical protein [Aequorivita sp. KMM 9714]
MSKKDNGENTELENANLEKQESELPSTNNENKIDPEIVSEPEEEDSFTEKWRNNRFLLIRGTYYLLHSIWMVIMVVGGFIAWLIALLFI